MIWSEVKRIDKSLLQYAYLDNCFLAIFGVIAAPTCSSRKSFPSFSFPQLVYLTVIAYAVTDPLPLANFPLPESWAGEIPHMKMIRFSSGSGKLRQEHGVMT
jgi:hypothetical protein